MEILSSFFIIAGVAFMATGIIGLFKFKSFYLRLLITSKIDTVGMITFLIGIAIRHGFSFFSAKLIFLIVIILILNPLVAHMLARSAYLSGDKMEDYQFDKH